MAKKRSKRRRRLTDVELKKRRREYMRKYNASPQARDAKRRYRMSVKGRKVIHRYNGSSEGHEAKRRYALSPKGREAI